jgi:hypothetical protein
LVKHYFAMKADLAAIAVAAPTTPVSANILQMARFFQQGVPADDATCVRLMKELRRHVAETEGEELTVRISDEFSIELALLPGGVAREAAEALGSDIECDAYGEQEEALEAWFRSTTRGLDRITGRATPEGCRQFIRDVRAAARALKEKGLCPKCPDEATASMRLPHCAFCAKCSW